MVRLEERSDDEQLDELIEAACRDHGLKLHTSGWARKTYDVYLTVEPPATNVLLARIESFAMKSGEVRVFDDRGLPFAQQVAEGLERAFAVKEATIVRDRTRS